MLFAPRAICVMPGENAARFGLTPLQDQQIAGLLMWVPANLVFFGIATFLFARWIGADATARLSLTAFRAPATGAAHGIAWRRPPARCCPRHCGYRWRHRRSGRHPACAKAGIGLTGALPGAVRRDAAFQDDAQHSGGVAAHHQGVAGQVADIRLRRCRAGGHRRHGSLAMRLIDAAAPLHLFAARRVRRPPASADGRLFR